MLRCLKLLAAVVVAIATVGPGTAAAHDAGPQRSGLVSGWAIQSSAAVHDAGAAISRPGYAVRGWLHISEPKTVMAGLIENGRYRDVFYSDNLAKVPTEQFDVNWWYRNEFLAHPRPGQHTFLVMNGVNGEANLWVNGVKVADASELQGSYARLEYDVTGLLHDGRNAIALDVAKNDDEFHVDPGTPAHKHLTLNMVDWNPPAPDRYTGLQFAPELATDGAVSMRNARVLQDNAADLSTSNLTVKADLRNNTGVTQRAQVRGTIGRDGRSVAFGTRVTVAPHATRTVVITPADAPGLRLRRPAVWWPATMGDQPLYRFALEAEVGGRTADRYRDEFGIRTVTSRLTPVVPNKTIGQDGYRQYLINGVPFVVRGAGWSQDMFLRYSPQTAASQLAYVKDMGLNTLRFEGNLPPDDMLDQMDRAGILAMAGWQCCDHWEDSFDTWTAVNRANAANQAAHVAQWLRWHPSVFTFFQGSDHAPEAGKEAIFLKAFRDADWETPQVAAATYQSSPQLGPSGSKEGMYGYHPPSSWWSDDPETANHTIPGLEFLFSGSAWGFESEASPGNTIPTQDSLDRFLTPEDQRKVWDPKTAEGPSAGDDIFHTSAYTEYYKVARMGVYNTALWKRYGPWSDMASYQRLAQLGQYEVTRAEFEAFIGHAKDPANPTTGVIYWMLNKAWPSLQWSMFGTDWDQPGVYFGAKKANEPVHVQYAYDDGSIQVANQTNERQAGLQAKVELIDLDGTVRSAQTVAVPALGAQDLQTVARPTVPADISRTYFAKLTLTRGSAVVSRNVYWLSTKPDLVDWPATHAGFQGYAAFKPDGYADLTGLQRLGPAPVTASASTRREGAELVTTVTLRNVGRDRTPAVGARVDVFAGGEQVLPIRWSDNQVTLWPGEEQTLTARYDPAALHGKPTVRLTGFNVATQSVGAR